MSSFRKMLGTLQRLTAFRAICRTMLPEERLPEERLPKGMPRGSLPRGSQVRPELLPSSRCAGTEREALLLARRAQLQQLGALERGL
jgi:hypothetical protein